MSNIFKWERTDKIEFDPEELPEIVETEMLGYCANYLLENMHVFLTLEGKICVEISYNGANHIEKELSLSDLIKEIMKDIPTFCESLDGIEFINTFIKEMDSAKKAAEGIRDKIDQEIHK